MAGNEDARDIYALCRALLSEEGDVSGQRLAEIILHRYSTLANDEKIAFFQFLNEELDIDATSLIMAATQYAQTHDTEAFKQVGRASEPKRQELLRRLNQPMGATEALVSMRVDLLRILKNHTELRRTDLDFMHLLSNWFNRGFLVLKQIDWDAPASLLDKIVAYEAVHEISDLDDLRRRLCPPDRRCFAFFHPAMPDEPLIFVEVALTQEIPCSIDELLLDQRDPLQTEAARAAVFYSISNCQDGLKGISFGNQLIKQVARELSVEFPQLTDFVTLSPIPNLNKWLVDQVENPSHGHVAASVLEGTAPADDVRAIAARYLVEAKREDGTPVDPVARFHLGNGAEIFAIHVEADSSENGQQQSNGAMVNYLYDLSMVERNHEEFALKAKVAASKSIKTLLRAQFKSSAV